MRETYKGLMRTFEVDAVRDLMYDVHDRNLINARKEVAHEMSLLR